MTTALGLHSSTLWVNFLVSTYNNLLAVWHTRTHIDNQPLSLPVEQLTVL